MITVITTVTKYIIILLMIIYTMSCYYVLKPVSAEEKERRYNKQVVLLFLWHFCCHLVLFLKLQSMTVIYYYGAEILLAGLYMVLYHMLYPKASRLLTNNVCFLLLLGYTMLTRVNFGLAKKQFLISAVALVLFSMIPYIILKWPKLKTYGYYYAIAGIAMLITVFIPGLGLRKYGAANWIQIRGISFQPSELAKITFILCIASLLYKYQEKKQLLLTAIIACLHIGILVLEKDLGGAAIFFMIFIMMLYTATGNKFYFFGVLGGGGTVGLLAYFLFKKTLLSHVAVRVNAWLDPWSCIDDSGYQVAQSLFAIGTGGWFGSGLTEGMPGAIPVRESDFIFSAIAEEFGVLFAMALILVYFSIFILIMNTAMKSRNRFNKVVTLGFGVCFIFQILLNIGGVTKFIPSTGVTLPLVSYGLSSVTSTLIIVQIIQAIIILVNKEADKIEREKKRYAATGDPEGDTKQRKERKKQQSS